MDNFLRTVAMIYFDHAAAARPDEDVLNFYLEALRSDFANQESLHQLSYNARMNLTSAGAGLCAALLKEPERFSVVWGESATGCFRLLSMFLKGKKVLSGTLEHPALTANFRKNCNLQLLSCARNGNITIPENIPECDAVIFHHVQSELGVIQDLKQLFSAFPGALHITDAVQAAGKLPLSPEADVHIISGIKFGSPGGAAILFRKDAPLLKKFPAFAAAYRSTEYEVSRDSVPLARTLAFAAARRAGAMQENFSRVSRLARRLDEQLAAEGITPTLPPESGQTPYIRNYLLRGVQSAVIVRALSAAGFAVAAGSACAAESGKPSAALRALGLSAKEAYSGLRISLDVTNTENDVDFLAFELKNALKNY